MSKLKLARPLVPIRDTRTVIPRPKQVLPFYQTPEWRSFIAYVIKKRGRRCESPGCGRTETRIFGDHIVEISDGGDLMDENNIKLLCGGCHTKKTMQARKARALTQYE